MCTETTCSTAGPAGVGRRALLGAALATPVALLSPAAARAAGTKAASLPRLLVFTRTAGFRHASIETAVQTIAGMGAANGFGVDATEDPTVFSRRSLAAYDAVAFVNTTGDVLEGTQRTALERFVRGGGGWAGVHSAADTEYSNDFYTELLAGGRFLAHPLQQPGLVVREDERHRSTRHLGETWLVPFEEFYSFTSSVRGRSRVLLSIGVLVGVHLERHAVPGPFEGDRHPRHPHLLDLRPRHERHGERRRGLGVVLAGEADVHQRLGPRRDQHARPAADDAQDVRVRPSPAALDHAAQRLRHGRVVDVGEPTGPRVRGGLVPAAVEPAHG